jgi:hypothetical protein
MPRCSSAGAAPELLTGVEPTVWDGQAVRRPGYVGASQIRARKRPASTARQYDQYVQRWIEFCEEGDGVQSYSPVYGSVAKFDLFAGWLLGDAAAGVPGKSRNKDLNAFRSAINRYIADRTGQRPLRDDPEISRTIQVYHDLQVESKAARGEDSDLHRVPCPEQVFVYLLGRGLICVGDELQWVALFMVMLLGWFRADTVAGLEPGDCAFAPDGALVLCVRRMKGRPDLRTRPKLLNVPAGRTAGHVRSRVFSVIRRALEADPLFYTALRQEELAGLARREANPGESLAATIATRKLRDLAAPAVIGLPPDVVIGSHSWREMAATCCAQARYDSVRMAAHGCWKKLDTMFGHYIDPYMEQFPWSRWLAELYDWLRAT